MARTIYLSLLKSTFQRAFSHLSLFFHKIRVGRASSQIDFERVGIMGGSAGGQNSTGAVIFHGDFYKAAASDCGCHDNRLDKIWWNEQWMDYPIGPHYSTNSNIDNAHKLTGKLLLTVGEIDSNVDPASTYKLSKALHAAGKDHELIIVPSSPRCWWW